MKILPVSGCMMLSMVLNSTPIFSQKVIEGKSPVYNFSITKEIKPPILAILDESIQFVEPGGNDIIDAGETCRILFSLENTGLGDGQGLALIVTATGSTEGLTYSRTKTLNDLKVGQKMQVEIPITANLNTLDGTVTFAMKVNEPNGFGTDEKQLELKTKKFVSPLVQVVDYTVTGGKGGALVKKFPFDLQVLVQNTQYGKAEDITVSLSLPENVLPISGNLSISVPVLKPGETQSMVYSLIVNDLFAGTQIPVTLKLKEKYGKFAEDKTLYLTLNQAVAANKKVIEGSQPPEEKPDIVIATLTTPVDKNIPITVIPHPNRYALIIGNEDYSSRQTGLAKEVNVDFAENDARIFKEYSVNTLGVPDRQVKLLINATAAEIRRELAWISGLIKLDNGQAEVFFYYSGHGLPDEITREPYLIPVDVSGSNIADGIKLHEVYTRLTENPSQRVTVFLDACFSGGARNQGLLAQKMVKIKPNEEALEGSLVVFSSSSGDESSGIDRKNQHGYFTWFLLKKLQETKGDVTYKELGDYIINGVSRETRIESKPQTPQVMVSPGVQQVWEGWRFK